VSLKKYRRFLRKTNLFESIILFFLSKFLIFFQKKISFKSSFLNGNSVTLRGKSSDFRVFDEIFLKEQYNSHLLPKNPKVILDAGANIGLSSVYFANRFPNAQVFALEPENSNYELLSVNTENFENIIPFKKALWSHSTNLRLANPNSEKWAFNFTESQQPSEKLYEAISIERFMIDYSVNEIDILKLDVEGAEKDIFSKNIDWIPKVKLLIVELHDRIVPGCSREFFASTSQYKFEEYRKGENFFLLRK
jgi:FkbM family methyltransferase